MQMVQVTTLALTAWCLVVPFRTQAQTPSTPAQSLAGEQINWVNWEKAMELSRDQKRKILIDIYTDWCKWCKYMESTTFQQPEIVRYINNNFYPVRFDAEQKKELIYQEKTFKYVRNGQMGYHELAAEWLRGRLSFPALVFLDEDLNIIQSFTGYKTAIQLEQIASYFASDHYKKTPWSTYQKMYKSILTDR